MDSEQSDKHPSAWFNMGPYLYVKIIGGVVYVIACLSFHNALLKENNVIAFKISNKIFDEVDLIP